MSIVSVEIELDTETGKFSVGIEPAGEDESAEPNENLTPARDIKDALIKAAQMLQQAAQGNDGDAEDQQDDGADEATEDPNAAMASGYNAVRQGGMNNRG